MKQFMILHIGFEPPTPEIMEAWNSWFAKISEHQVDQAGLMNGREISNDGVSELAWDANAITGYNVVEAESIEDALALCEGNPFISSIRVYELRRH